MLLPLLANRYRMVSHVAGLKGYTARVTAVVQKKGQKKYDPGKKLGFFRDKV